jgi:hypothetical protein
VHLDQAGAELVRIPDDGSEPIEVCKAPCDREVAAGVTYRVELEDHEDTSDFVLPASARGIVLSPSPDATGTTLGVGLLIVPGSMAVASGLVLIGLDQGGRADFQGTSLAGGIIAASGAVVAIGGVVVYALCRSDLSIDQAAKKAARGFEWDFGSL